MTPTQTANLRRLLSPRHIAFIGGRDCLTAIGEAERRGFSGQIWPVNPTRDRMLGHACFASVDDLPEAPDAVFLAVPAPAAIGVTAALARRPPRPAHVEVCCRSWGRAIVMCNGGPASGGGAGVGGGGGAGAVSVGAAL